MTSAKPATSEQTNNNNPHQTMKDLVALCKRRGFIFGASDIYDGLNGFWDYGPLGIQLKKNIADKWWFDMVECPPIGPDGEVLSIVGLDSSIIQNPKTWEASGHLAGFSDPMVDCRETKKRYRADHVEVLIPTDPDAGNWIAFMEGLENEELEKRIKKLRKGHGSLDEYTRKDLPSIDLNDYERIIAPDVTIPGTLTPPKDFNLMFKTFIGATATEHDDNTAYLRPETAQGIFLNFKNVVDSSRVQVPFGIAQIGKAFRNEVTPRNYIFRSREFEQMELEWFCHEDDAQKWFDFWVEERGKWWSSIGIRNANIRKRPHDDDELAHYAKNGAGCIDLEFKFPFTDPDFGELEGVAHRSNYDLTKHEKHSGKKISYQDPQTNEWFLPHVIEPAAGLTRGVLAVLANAFTYDSNRPSGHFMDFHYDIAPVQIAVLPLHSKGEQVEMSQKIYHQLRSQYRTQIDIKQNIGKRYARQDEIGTPICITIDPDSLSDNQVTVRHRNNMDQDRVSLDSFKEYLRNTFDNHS